MKKGIFSTILALSLVAAIFIIPIANSRLTRKLDENSTKINKSPVIITPEKKEESSAAEVTPAPKSDQKVTFIVTVNGDSLIDTVIASKGKYNGAAQFLISDDSRKYCDKIKKDQAVVKASIKRIIPQANFDNCYTYNTVLNGFTVKAPYSCLEKLKKIEGVNSVILSTSSETKISSVSEELNFSKSMLNMNLAYESDFGGSGMLIAVIDDSFECDNAVFSKAPDYSKYNISDIGNLFSCVSFNVSSNNNSSKAEDVYKSDKIVFAYDYADHDNNTSCSSLNHGTRTAGIAAGNNGLYDDNMYRGAAYDAQLVLMKVSSDTGETISDESVLAALDDAAKLSPDVINCSFGVPRSYSSASVFDSVYEKLSSVGTYITAAAGNSSYNRSAVSENKFSYSFVDYGTVSYPASLSSVTAVGSVNTSEHTSYYFTANDFEKIEYTDILLYQNGITTENEFLFNEVFFEDIENLEYLYIDSEGTEDDYKERDIRGKIVVVNRGKITFSEKIHNAYLYDAAGIIIINNENEDYYAFSEEILLPSVIIPERYKSYFEENTTGFISVNNEKDVFTSSAANTVSSFSSYGVTADLRLKPEICAAGTNVYSPFEHESYSSVSGTSMSSAYIAGAAAVIKQYLTNSETLSGAYNGYGNDMISAVLMNNANTLKYDDSGLYYTPRVQGAGAADISAAVSADSYIIVRKGSAAKADLGDSETGRYDFEFILYNTSYEKHEYSFSSAIQTDMPEQSETGVVNTLIPMSLEDYADIVFSIDEIPVTEIEIDGNSSVTVNVSIKIDPSYILSEKNNFPDGFYVDGYVFAEYDERKLTVPFMGFCGNWAGLPIFDDSAIEGDNKTAIISTDNHIAAVSEFGKTYPKYELGRNIFTGEYSSENIFVGKETMANYLENPLVGITFILPDCTLLRDAFNYTIDISNSSGKSIFRKNYGTLSAFISNDTEPYLNLLSTINTDDLKNLFSDLSEGSYTYTVSADTMGADGNVSSEKIMSYNFSVDNTKPVKTESKTYVKDGKVYLTLTAKDNQKIQGFLLNTAVRVGNSSKYDYADSLDMLAENSMIDKDSYILKHIDVSENGEVNYTYDVTKLYSQLLRVKARTEDYSGETSALKIVFRAVDYAYNLSSPKVADTVAYGNAEISFIDNNGKPVSGVKIICQEKEIISGDDGKAVIDGLKSGMYAAYITSLPENYISDINTVFIYTTNDSIDFSKEIILEYTGEELPEDESSDIEIISDENKEIDDSISENKTDFHLQAENDSKDNSLYAFAFVGVLLVINVASLVVTKVRLR